MVIIPLRFSGSYLRGPNYNMNVQRECSADVGWALHRPSSSSSPGSRSTSHSSLPSAWCFAAMAPHNLKPTPKPQSPLLHTSTVIACIAAREAARATTLGVRNNSSILWYILCHTMVLTLALPIVFLILRICYSTCYSILPK